MENIKKKIIEKRFSNDTAYLIRESVNLLHYMPKQI